MQQGQVRIIGGKWRGRKLKFPELPGLRPTPDRVRETLFNWLTPAVVGAHCLDLFAGSGALGLEALSRGAASVLFVDQQPPIIEQLRNHISLLKADNASVQFARFPFPLKTPTHKFDIVFLDPPYHQGLIAKACDWLVTQNLLAENAYLYLETEAELSPLPIPESWKITHSKKAGQVGYHLVQAVPKI